MNWFPHWFYLITGSRNESGAWYAFWSGFGSDIGEVALLGGLITIVRHHNCHQRGCWRLGSMTTKRGHKLCKHHAGKPNSELNLHEIHEDHHVATPAPTKPKPARSQPAARSRAKPASP